MEKVDNLIDFLIMLNKLQTNNIINDYYNHKIHLIPFKKHEENKSKPLSLVISYLSVSDLLNLKVVNKVVSELINEECIKNYLRENKIQNVGNLISIWYKFSNVKE